MSSGQAEDSYKRFAAEKVKQDEQMFSTEVRPGANGQTEHLKNYDGQVKEMRGFIKSYKRKALEEAGKVRGG